jgi:photosynthetic reaction center M subunit
VVDDWFLWAVKHGVAPHYAHIYGAVPDPAAGTPAAAMPAAARSGAK